MTEHRITIALTQEQDFQFRVRFDSPEGATLLVDEPAPLGRNTGPNPERLVAAAVANCLSASLLFAIRKFKQDAGPVSATATTTVQRNDRGRLRIAGIDVAIHLGNDRNAIAHLDRALEQFEDFCVVTESIRQGIPVNVTVSDAQGPLRPA